MNNKKNIQSIALVCLMGVAIFLLFPHIKPYIFSQGLDGENEILDIRVVEKDDKSITIDVDYFYNGQKTPTALLQVTIVPQSGYEQRPPNSSKLIRPGKGTVRLNIFWHSLNMPVISEKITAEIKSSNAERFVFSSIDHREKWMPDIRRVALHPLKNVNKDNIDFAYEQVKVLIDSNNRENIRNAKTLLEKMIQHDPEYVSAYVQLARVSMRQKGFSALNEAENLLLLALRKDSNHARALVLLGYVHTHQKRFKDAREALERAEEIGTDNLWLYNNLGELAVFEGKLDEAAEHYMRVIDAPMPEKSFYYREKLDGYHKLAAVFSETKEYKRLRDMQEKATKDFPSSPCTFISLAEAELYLGEFKSALETIEQGIECREDYAESVRAASYFANWANALSSEELAKKDEWYTKAQLAFPNEPELFAYLAANEKMSSVVRKMIDGGMNINGTTHRGATALTFAITSDYRVEAIERLIQLGADINMAVTDEKWTPLMIAVSQNNIEIVKLLVKYKVEKTAVNIHGHDATDLANSLGLTDIVKLLNKTDAA